MKRVSMIGKDCLASLFAKISPLILKEAVRYFWRLSAEQRKSPFSAIYKNGMQTD
jgi:hypothetical protein